MIRTRLGFVSLALFALLCGGASSASKNPRISSPKPERSSSTGAGKQAGAAVRLLRPQMPALSGAGQCPSGIEVELWPPNHKYVDIDLQPLLGSNTTGIEILSITQDEAVDERGSGNTECDGDGVGTSVAHIRAERSGRGNGRVYEIEYSANAGSCSGFIHVLVPHDQSGRPAEDDGQDHDSTEGCD